MITGFLNDLLKNELTASNQFRLHAVMLEVRGCKELGSHTRRKANDALEHIDALANRMLSLNAIPNVGESQALRIGQSVKAQLENDLALQQDAVPRLTSAIRECDESTRALLEKILVDAEHHVDWLESQLHLIAEIGLETFLAQQSAASAD